MSAVPFVDVIDTQLAADFVKEQLLGGTTLAKLVARSIDLSRGRYRVAMPEGIKANQGLDFRFETFPLKPSARENDFARLVKSFICVEECDLILQDTGTSMSFPYFAKLPYRRLAVSYGEEIYWSLAEAKLANLSEDEMGDLVNYASFWPFSAFFYVDGNPAPKLNDADLQLIVDRLVGLAVGAFDDRSYLVWWRDDLRPFPLG